MASNWFRGRNGPRIFSSPCVIHVYHMSTHIMIDIFLRMSRWGAMCDMCAVHTHTSKTPSRQLRRPVGDKGAREIAFGVTIVDS